MTRVKISLATAVLVAACACGPIGGHGSVKDGKATAGDGAVKMSVNESQKAISDEIRAAIKSATPKAVYPKDDLGKAGDCGAGKQNATIRVAGWDPDEKQSNEDLLKKSTVYLKAHGWEVATEFTDSDDQSARVSKAGVGDGRLYVSNQGFTFTGNTECAEQ